MNEINLKVETKTVETQIRKIRFKWTRVLPDEIEVFYDPSVSVYYKNLSLVLRLKKRKKR